MQGLPSCRITPELEYLSKGCVDKSPACVHCHKMTKLPSVPPGLVTVESCVSDMNCNPKVITRVQGRDEGCLYYHLRSIVLEARSSAGLGLSEDLSSSGRGKRPVLGKPQLHLSPSPERVMD